MKKRQNASIISKQTQLKRIKREDHDSRNDTHTTATITTNGGLFDDLDEEMDPNVMDSVLQQLEDENGNNSDDNDNDDDDNGEDTGSLSPSIPDIDQDNDGPEEEMDEEEETTPHDDDEPSVTSKPSNQQLSSKFRDHYMGKITQAFGSDLDQIRQDPGFTASRLNVLIDSLESGISIFSDLEKSISLADVNDS
ncbi:uncharacterized protein BX664DRAFT_382430 [Halteromyces radiatus]|uniref:uncharacterized protein n=1 Tax=Halteromyces radiatus TaxID=101107 RepID=UPI00221F0816|nr:uncharacterized protein BX664DRAFT_382430 [Halteromyces radiatus]KAI8099971.1 hypothetical protein BX664DRAFT_382430 [Halteromyces radiatus]